MLRLKSSDPDFGRAFTRLVKDRRESDENVARDVQTIIEDVRLRGDARAGRVDRQACARLPFLTVRRMGERARAHALRRSRYSALCLHGRGGPSLLALDGRFITNVHLPLVPSLQATRTRRVSARR